MPIKYKQKTYQRKLLSLKRSKLPSWDANITTEGMTLQKDGA